MSFSSALLAMEVLDPAQWQMVEPPARRNSSNLVLDCTPDLHATTSSVQDARVTATNPNADEEIGLQFLIGEFHILCPLDAGLDPKPCIPGLTAVEKTTEAEKSSAEHSPDLAHRNLHYHAVHTLADSDIPYRPQDSTPANSTAAHPHTPAADSEEVSLLANSESDPLVYSPRYSP